MSISTVGKTATRSSLRSTYKNRNSVEEARSSSPALLPISTANKVLKQSYQQVEFNFSGIDNKNVDIEKVHEVIADMLRTFFGESSSLLLDMKTQDIATTPAQIKLVSDSLDKNIDTRLALDRKDTNKRTMECCTSGEAEKEEFGEFQMPEKKLKH